MPDAISSIQQSGSAYYGVRATVREGASTVEPADGSPGDTVEISGDSGEGQVSSGGSRSYAPRSIRDRFRFNIQSGMFDSNQRYSPLSVRFAGKATRTYTARQSVSTQVSQVAGAGSPYGALFSLMYQDAQPNPGDARTQVDARVAQHRMMDQHIQLLSVI